MWGFLMIFPLGFRLWIEKLLRARRYARADKPLHPTPPWIGGAASFSLLDANPISSIAAAKVRWMEPAGQASRLLGSYAVEIQHAADALDASRSRLALSKPFVHAPNAATGSRHAPLALSDASEIGAIERQRRALSMEREALCLLAASLRLRYGAADPGAPLARPDPPHPLLSGMTLLAYFVSIRRVDVVELLLLAGARADAPCLDGSTALSIASLKADAISRSCPASSQAALILVLLESSSLHEGVRPGSAQRPRRL